jgi:hypothetical protein
MNYDNVLCCSGKEWKRSSIIGVKIRRRGTFKDQTAPRHAALIVLTSVETSKLRRRLFVRSAEAVTKVALDKTVTVIDINCKGLSVFWASGSVCLSVTLKC